MFQLCFHPGQRAFHLGQMSKVIQQTYHHLSNKQHLVGVNWVQVHNCHHLFLFLFFPDPQLPAGWEILAENDYSPGFHLLAHLACYWPKIWEQVLLLGELQPQVLAVLVELLVFFLLHAALVWMPILCHL